MMVKLRGCFEEPPRLGKTMSIINKRQRSRAMEKVETFMNVIEVEGLF